MNKPSNKILSDEQIRLYAREKLYQDAKREGYEGMFAEYFVGLKLDQLIEEVKKWRDACYSGLEGD